MEQLQQPQTQTSSRNYGVDALRIVSIFMVLILHVLGLGGILSNTSYMSPTFLAAWTLETAAMCAVNCYGLISGYVGIYGKLKYSNLAGLWLQVFLYSFVGALVFWLLDPSCMDVETLILSAFPVIKVRFWYFTAYVGLSVLRPVINRGLLALNRRQAKVLCVSIVVLFCVLPSLLNTDSFDMDKGYSLIWLLLLYCLGACIRRFDFLSGIKSRWLVLWFVASVGIAMGVLVVLCTRICPWLSDHYGNTLMQQYTSPTMLGCALAILLLFTRLQIKRKWLIGLISFFAPATFGVYILHMQPQLRGLLFDQSLYAWLGQAFPLVTVGLVLLSAGVLFVVCALIEKLRQLLFDTLGVKKRLERLEEKYVGDLWSTEN